MKSSYELEQEVVGLEQQLSEKEAVLQDVGVLLTQARGERDMAKARLAASDVACVQMRVALEALAGTPAEMMAYCKAHGLEYVSNPVADHWRVQIARAALATDAGTTLLAELAALRAVAEAAVAHVELLGQCYFCSGRVWPDEGFQHADKCPLADLAQSQQRAHGEQGTALQVKDEEMGGEAVQGGASEIQHQ